MSGSEDGVLRAISALRLWKRPNGSALPMHCPASSAKPLIASQPINSMSFRGMNASVPPYPLSSVALAKEDVQNPFTDIRIASSPARTVQVRGFRRGKPCAFARFELLAGPVVREFHFSCTALSQAKSRRSLSPIKLSPYVSLCSTHYTRELYAQISAVFPSGSIVPIRAKLRYIKVFL